MAQNDEQEIDLDALQAQINMAMAEEEALVSSWIKPSKSSSKRPKRTFDEMERELQDYMRRPARLGVGAPIPDRVGPTAQEEARLKYKLVGNDKKRKHKEELDKKLDGDVEDDEEEGKKGESGLSTKVARADPFSLPKKKAKHKNYSGKQDLERINNAKPTPTINGISTSTRAREASTQANDQSNREGSKSVGTNSENSEPLVNGISVSVPLTPVEVTTLVVTPKPLSAKQSNESKTATSATDKTPPLLAPTVNGQATGHDTSRAAESANTLLANATEAESKTAPPSPSFASHTGAVTQTLCQSQQLMTPVSPSSQSTLDNHLSKSARKKKNRRRKKKLNLEQSLANANAANGSGAILNGVAISEPDVPTRSSDAISESNEGKVADHKQTRSLVNGIATEDAALNGRVERTNSGDSVVAGSKTDSITSNGGDANNVATEPQSQPSDVSISPNPKPLSASRPPGGLPLLNLTGPPVPDADNSDMTHSPSSPSKKRRKRRNRNRNKGMKTTDTNGAENRP